jgi:hypothetical protein
MEEGDEGWGDFGGAEGAEGRGWRFVGGWEDGWVW